MNAPMPKFDPADKRVRSPRSLLGMRNRRTKETIGRIIAAGGTDPLVRLSQIVTNEQELKSRQ
jgi:hypothetical protein